MKKSVGTKFLIGSNAVGGLTSIGGLNLSKETLDSTTLDSDGGYREFIGGFKDGGEVSLSGYLAPNSQGQTDMYDAFENSDAVPFQIIFPPAVGISWTFDGVVTAFATGAELDSLISFEATVKVSGKPSLNRSASAGLTALSLTGTGGTLTPPFSSPNGNYAYAGVTATSVTVTATAANHTIRLFVDGTFVQHLTSGVVSNSIAIPAGSGKRLTFIVQETGKAPKAYEIVATRST